MHGFLKRLFFERGWVPEQHVQSWLNSIDPMHKHSKMNGRIPWNRIPRHGALGDWKIGTGHDPLQHGKKSSNVDGSLPVKGQGATPLMNDLSGGKGWNFSLAPIGGEGRGEGGFR